MGSVKVVLGLNYGDEGKGKVSTFLAQDSDIVSLRKYDELADNAKNI